MTTTTKDLQVLLLANQKPILAPSCLFPTTTSDQRTGSSILPAKSFQQLNGLMKIIKILVAKNSNLELALSRSQQTERWKAVKAKVLQGKLKH